MQLYRGQRLALGTMHAKERAIAPPFARVLAAEIVVPEGLDTDAFGTFMGDVERVGTMLDAARAKARLAMQRTGLCRGIASEGSYGAHPLIPLIPGGSELVLFIDDERGIEVKYSFVVPRTNYDSHVCSGDDDIAPVLQRWGFPRHAITVRPHQVSRAGGEGAGLDRGAGVMPAPVPRFKGLRARCEIDDAVRLCAAASADGKACLVPDMRAHVNPTRMAMIRVAATRLARRIASLCPACQSPGFGVADLQRGLPCAACGAATPLATAEIHRCVACSYATARPLRRLVIAADPRHCPLCNP